MQSCLLILEPTNWNKKKSTLSLQGYIFIEGLEDSHMFI